MTLSGSSQAVQDVPRLRGRAGRGADLRGAPAGPGRPAGAALPRGEGGLRRRQGREAGPTQGTAERAVAPARLMLNAPVTFGADFVPSESRHTPGGGRLPGVAHHRCRDHPSTPSLAVPGGCRRQPVPHTTGPPASRELLCNPLTLMFYQRGAHGGSAPAPPAVPALIKGVNSSSVPTAALPGFTTSSQWPPSSLPPRAAARVVTKVLPTAIKPPVR